ncbi:MAG: transpeptidase family protein [Bacteroidales bacterium]|nr:transpeptidase family protein [Bacteroidales bacterium]
MAARRQKKNETGRSMGVFHVVYFLLAALSIAAIIHIQFFWKPDEKTKVFFLPRMEERVIHPERGSILARDGRPMAMAVPNYHVIIDCAIRKGEFEENWKEKQFTYHYKVGRRDSTVRLTGKEMEQIWRENARKLCEGLEKILGGKSADRLYREIINGREHNCRTLKLAEFIDHESMLAIKELPLARDGRYKGGVIFEEESVREYPYGSLARRTIGYLPKKGNISGNKTGIEYSYDSLLRGTPGWEKLMNADGGQKIVDHRSRPIRVKDGYDVRTTLDVDMQNLCDRELRKTFALRDDIEGGCMLIMEVATGAIRAMVNLKKNEQGEYVENYNYAVLYKGATGSVFKAATLMALLEDGKVHLRDTVPTYGGIYKFQGWTCDDTQHTGKSRYPSGRICIGEGLEISSNIVFSTLVWQHYREHPTDYTGALHRFHLDENFDFDIHGLPAPIIPQPGQPNWSGSTLPNISIGSSIDLTPLHTLTFYNAIAGRGRMMKPYLVEAIEKEGKVVHHIDPVCIDRSICSKSTADTLTKGLCRVTEGKNGTAYWSFRHAPYRFAGKTGTGRLTIYDKNGRPVTNIDGATKNIGTFIGFFPAEAPKYTVMAVGYQEVRRVSLYGSVFANTVRAVCDNLWAMDCMNGEKIKERRGSLERSRREQMTAHENGVVPDLKGHGLDEALYELENNGYTCEYSGVGRVAGQSPAAGSRLSKGSTVRIVLK